MRSESGPRNARHGAKNTKAATLKLRLMPKKIKVDRHSLKRHAKDIHSFLWKNQNLRKMRISATDFAALLNAGPIWSLTDYGFLGIAQIRGDTNTRKKIWSVFLLPLIGGSTKQKPSLTSPLIKKSLNFSCFEEINIVRDFISISPNWRFFEHLLTRSHGVL